MTTLQQHEYVFERVNDSVMTRTMEGRINFWNRSAEELYGWRKEEAIGRVSHESSEDAISATIGRDRFRTRSKRTMERQARAYHPRWQPRDGRKPVDLGSHGTVRSGR